VTLINKAQEKISYKLLPQSHSPRVELLHIHHVAEEDDVDGVKGSNGSGFSSGCKQGETARCAATPPHKKG
jgi:hypothetical protein